MTIGFKPLPLSPTGPATESTPVHFLGTFKSPKYFLLQSYWQNADIEPFFATETNVHFLAKFTPTKLNVPKHLREHYDFNPPVIETNVHFISKYVPTRLNVSTAYRFHNDVQPPVIETNVSFVGIFKPTRYFINTEYRHYPDNQPPVQETNVSFVGTFKPTRYFINPEYRQYPDNQPPVTETNVHFVGTFKPSILRVLQGLLQNTAQDITSVVPPEVGIETYFTGKFKPTRIYRNPAYTQHYDYNPRVGETNPHFIGRYSSTLYRINRNLRHNSSIDAFVPKYNYYIQIIG